MIRLRCFTLTLAWLIVGLPSWVHAQGKIYSDPITPGGQISAFYEVRTNGTTIPVESYNSLSYASFTFEGSVTLDIAFREPIVSYVLSPQADEVESVIEDGLLRVSLDRPLKLILHRINGQEEMLFLFADAPEANPPRLGDAGVVNVLDFGVDSEGINATTEQFQIALDAAGQENATLYVPRGRYRTRELFIPSNITLYLESGALLFADDNPESYEPSYGYGLLRVENASNVTIRGRGVIDGRGTFWRSRGGWYGMIYATHSRNLRVEDIILRDSTTFNVWIESSTDWHFENLKIMADADYTNTDGFDVISSSDGIIEDVLYLGTDDFSSFGSEEDNPRDIHDVTIRDAVLYTGGAFKIGTTTWMNRIHDLTYENIDIVFAEDVFMLYVVGSASYEDILFKTIRIEDILDVPPGPRGWAGGRLFNFIIEVADWEEGSSAHRLGSMNRISICNVTSADWGGGQSVFAAYDDGTYQYGITDLIMNKVVVDGQMLSENDMSRFRLLAPHLVDVHFRSDGVC